MTHRSSAATHRMVFARGSGTPRGGKPPHRRHALELVHRLDDAEGESAATSMKSPGATGAPAGRRRSAGAGARRRRLRLRRALPRCRRRRRRPPPSPRRAAGSGHPRRATNCPGQKSCSPGAARTSPARHGGSCAVLPQHVHVRARAHHRRRRAQRVTAAFSETRLSLNRRASARFISSATTDRHRQATLARRSQLARATGLPPPRTGRRDIGDVREIAVVCRGTV